MSVNGKGVKAIVRRNHAPCGGDREEEEGLERGDNPLLNDLILDTLFGFVERSDLKECRMVSRKWNVHSIPHMRATFEVTILGSQSNCETRRIDHFVELLSANEFGIPFGRFQLGAFRVTGKVGRQFIRLCGETVKEIDLQGEESDVFIIQDVSDLLRSSPNLEIFHLPYRLVSRSGNIVKLFPDSIPRFSSLKKISCGPDIKKGLLKFCPTLIEELMSGAPNISDIVVEDEKENDDEDSGRNVNLVLNCIEKLGRESSIQSLNIGPATLKDIDHMERMAKKGLRLKNLTIDPKSFGDDLANVQTRLATSFKDTLQYFNVGEILDNILMEFPNMPKLKSLTQRIKHGSNSTTAAENLNEKFPALETLEIGFERRNEEDLDKFLRALESYPTLKSLNVENNPMSIFGFHNILRVFPNMKKLNFRIGADGVEILRQVWSQMTGLESLSISGYIERREKDYLDSLFTGIPTHAIREITPVVNGLEQMTVQNRRETIERLQEDHSELPSLRNLTKLRHLDLSVSGGKNCNFMMSAREIHLTDLTGYLALYTMSHLKFLKLNQTRISKTCCEMLTTETGLEILYH